MSDTTAPATADAPPKVKPQRGGTADQDAFAQVDKWLALIREMAREQSKRAS